MPTDKGIQCLLHKTVELSRYSMTVQSDEWRLTINDGNLASEVIGVSFKYTNNPQTTGVFEEYFTRGMHPFIFHFLTC